MTTYAALAKTEHVFCTYEKNFYLNPPICYQNGCVWAGGRKADVEPHQLLVEREKFVPHCHDVGKSVRQKRTSVLRG